jgi:hypothetical protein
MLRVGVDEGVEESDFVYRSVGPAEDDAPLIVDAML